MVFVLYLILLPVFDKKSAPIMRSYLQFSASNTRALMLLIFLLLSSSGSLILLNFIISEVLNKPASVVIFLVFSILNDWQFLVKHCLLIRVVVEPESNSAFSILLDVTEEMLSITTMVMGVSLLVSGKMLISPFHHVHMLYCMKILSLLIVQLSLVRWQWNMRVIGALLS